MHSIAAAVTAASLALSAAPASAMGELASEFNDVEKTFWAATEQALSIVAALVDKRGCSDTSYPFSIDVFSRGPSASVTIGGAQRVGFEADLERSNGDGTHISTGAAFGAIAGSSLAGLVGNYYYDGDGGIFYGRADFRLGGTAYDEHIIKDYFKGRAFRNPNGVRDQGLEVITKNDLPRAKYKQRSRYLEPNGVDGFMTVTKNRVMFAGAGECKILIGKTQLFDANDGLQVDGEIVVNGD